MHLGFTSDLRGVFVILRYPHVCLSDSSHDPVHVDTFEILLYSTALLILVVFFFLMTLPPTPACSQPASL